jgi:uncharacterized protein
VVSNKPVTIAVIADTHVNRLDELPSPVLSALTKVDLILHLGDFTSPQLLNDLKNLGNFYGIWGNHDRLPEMRQRLKRIEVLEIDGKRLGLIHGLFYPVARQRRMLAWLKKYKIDILLFGHSHIVTNKVIDGVYIFNPGTVTCKFPATQGSFGILTLNGSITSKVIPIKYDIPIKQRLLMLLPTLIIREGTSFLESWPYIDVSPIWAGIKLALKRINLVIRKYCNFSSSGIKHFIR